MTYPWTQLDDDASVSFASEHPDPVVREAMSARVAGTLFYYNQLRSSMLSDRSDVSGRLHTIAGNFDQSVREIMDLHPMQSYYATELADFIKNGSSEDAVTRLNALFEQLQSVVPASQRAQQSDGSAPLAGGDEGKQSYSAMLLDMLRQLREAAPSSYCSAM